MKKYNKTLLAVAFMAAMGVTGCGSDGSDGAAGAAGADGTDGTSAGLTVTTVESAANFNLTLAPADIVVVGTDAFSVKFSVTGEGTGGTSVPFSGLEKVALYVTSQSANTTDTGAPMLWTNHALANDFGSSMYCNLTGSTTARDGSEVEACTLVEDPANPGTYTGTWEHDGNAPVVLADGDANDLVRVMIRAYDVVMADGTDVSDKPLSTPIDFIPATGELAVSAKDAVSNAACIKCHSPMEGYADTDLRISNISAHHNYQKVENCVACHNPAYAGGQDDEEVGFNANFNAMIHTIHMGEHLADSLTGEAKEMFGGIAFPAEANECTVCHDNGTQWNDNVYAEACVSCHVDVNLETGENHNGIVPSSDAVCSGCHGSGSLSPMEAHSVNRRAAFEDGLVLDVVSADVASDVLTVVIGVELNGAVAADGTDLTMYLNKAKSGDDILIGTLDSNGDYIRGLSVNTVSNPEMFVVAGGQLTLTKSLTANQLDGKTISVSSELNMCGNTTTDMIVENTMLADGAGTDTGACDVAVPSNIVTKYFVFDTVAAAGAETTTNLRFVSPELTGYTSPTQVGNDRTTADEAKCNACHDNLSHVKSPNHGVTNFTQCADCHNNNYPGSYHADVYKQSGVDDDGEPTFEVVEGLEYYNRDLATVAHRFHSGLFAGSTGAGIYLDTDDELVNYPAVQTNCQACHKDANAAGDAMPFFDGTGELTSGRTAIEISGGEFISPVAEACRSCHAHSGAAALAHFKSNGATVFGDNITSADDVPVESCATCHADGKTYGVDVVHGSSAH
ncbi:OmcA/MtrC family decaheme c-type cytochrome [Shewanella polaris]|uniref:OmcA/MtrC family decaheme c-type cytochrome n=1 Tax=Shewanella polaris TaxID=2588449 RepID=A0A4Y5YHZ2_9GAMM|nr:OmcA/MtrC family decaheme c-type cytochrome [Shewanella polaris]QDE32235.1 OmcA/MtrC family decaheme c-type cytochrome [Shewanella polaris]